MQVGRGCRGSRVPRERSWQRSLNLATSVYSRDVGLRGPSRGWTWEGAWARGHCGSEACSRSSWGTVGTWENGSVCSSVQLGVSATRAICRPKSPPHPASGFFPLSPGTPAARWGRPRSVGSLPGNPHPSWGSSRLRGHPALSGNDRCFQDRGRGSPARCRAGRGPDGGGWEGLWLYGLGPKNPVGFSPSAQQGHEYPQFQPGGPCASWLPTPGFPWLLHSSHFSRTASLHSDLCSDRSSLITPAPPSPFTLRYPFLFLHLWFGLPAHTNVNSVKTEALLLFIALLPVPRTVPAYNRCS